MGSLYILSAFVLWSSLGIVIRLSGVEVHVLVFYALLVATPLLGLAVVAGGYVRRFPKGRDMAAALVLGPLSLLNVLTFFYALKNTTISNALLTHYIAPVIVAFLAAVFLREPLTRWILAAVALSSAGLWIMLGQSPVELVRAVFQEPGRESLGVLSGLFSGLTYAVIILLMRVLAINYSPVVLTFMQNLVMAICLAPAIKGFPAHALWAYFTMGVLHFTIAPLLYFKGLSTVRANRAAILGYLEPLSAIILGMVFFAEYPRPVALLGGAMILLSGYLTIRERR